MNSFKSRLLSLLTVTLFVLPVFVTSGCKELSNDPPATSANLVVNLSDIQKQVGVQPRSDSENAKLQSVSTPGDSDATNQVKSLLVGAFVVTTRDDPYSTDVAITDDIEEDVQDDLAASVDYIKIVDLPTSKNYIEFSYPKSELSRWQVIAVALDFKISEFAELGEDKHEDSVLYMGFTDRFYTASSIEKVDEVDIVMQRACLLNAVKGCATYGAEVDDEPVVTQSVEILGVRYNGRDSDVDMDAAGNDQFPYIVRTDSDADAAINYLEEVRTEIESIVGQGNITSLTVRTTHTGSGAENSDCQALHSETTLTEDQLVTVAECSIQYNKISYVSD